MFLLVLTLFGAVSLTSVLPLSVYKRLIGRKISLDHISSINAVILLMGLTTYTWLIVNMHPYNLFKIHFELMKGVKTLYMLNKYTLLSFTTL